MSNRWPRIVGLVAVLSVGTAWGGQDPDFPHTLTESEDGRSPKAAIEQASFLVGHWVGEGLGGVSEEMWAPPADGAMMGMYRLLRDGKVVFYEFLTLIEEEGSLVLKLKHFHPDLKGWEEKDGMVRFPLVKVEEGQLWFKGLTFRANPDGTLSIWLRLRGGDGVMREMPFLLKKQS